MTRTMVVLLTMALSALGWQSRQMDEGRRVMAEQAMRLNAQSQALTKQKSQLISLSILTETNSREQTRLYAAAEQNTALLRNHHRRVEGLKNENEDLLRWAYAALPADIIRLRSRPALTGGAAYREWLSRGDSVPAGKVRAAQQRRSKRDAG